MHDRCYRQSLARRAAVAVFLAASGLWLSAQEPVANPSAATPSPVVNADPIAIVPLDAKNPAEAPTVTGALEVSKGKAVIVASGAVTAGMATVSVTLPRRGVLRICASTTVKLAADSSVPAGETPGLLMALDRGAVEASFATGRNADILLTPDFRILISGPGPAEVKVRLGAGGDTCVDNAIAKLPGPDSSVSGAPADLPYVLVTSVFDSGNYRVQPGQRVMFERGNLHEVVDHEKESCGCPPATTSGNEFPLAQSEGLAPAPPQPPAAAGAPLQKPDEPVAAPFVYKAEDHTTQPAVAPTAAAPPTTPQPAKKKPGRLARFFHKIFGGG